MPRQPFNTRWAQGVESEDNLNTFKDPGAVRVSTGWEGGQDKDAPPAGHENYWHNRVDSALQGIERTGVMTYHSQAVYGIGCPTYAPDGNYYESLVANNTGNDPASTSGYWRFIGSSFFSGSDPGDIKIVGHNNVPSAGWLKCNGAAVLRASYPRLFEQIGTIWNIGGESSLQFRVPDFRGEFLRGFDDGRGVDTSRQFASFQKGTLVSFDSTIETTSVVGLRNVSVSPEQNYRDFIGADRPNNDYPGAVFAATGGSSGSIESTPNNFGVTRPRNRAVNFWIKY